MYSTAHLSLCHTIRFNLKSSVGLTYWAFLVAI
jgi:hypothetical protein